MRGENVSPELSFFSGRLVKEVVVHYIVYIYKDDIWNDIGKLTRLIVS